MFPSVLLYLDILASFPGDTVLCPTGLDSLFAALRMNLSISSQRPSHNFCKHHLALQASTTHQRVVPPENNQGYDFSIMI